jgi:hypothetical protein
MSSTRPTYENDETLRIEREIIDRVAPQFDCTAFKNPMSYRVDFSLIREGDIVAFAEVKRRYHTFGKYPTFMLSLAKYIAACEMARMTSTTALVIVQWDDVTGYALFPCEFTLAIGGRDDRGDGQDKEPCIYVALKHFILL